MKKKITWVAGLTIAAVLGVSGCGKNEAQTEAVQTESQTVSVETQAETETETQGETEMVIPEGKARSFLTGEIVDESLNERRPVALMINNVTEALPQSGIGQADILYEAVVEGKITRMMAVFQDYETLEKVGPIRSARHYYLDFAHDEEAIYGHFGWSIYAQNRIQSEGIKTLQLMAGGLNSDYYRSDDRVAPHNVYMTGEQIVHAIGTFGVDTAMPENYEGRLNFNNTDTEPAGGADAATVDISMSSSPHFEYDADQGVYMKSQYGEPQIDDVTGDQLSFENIIIQYAPYTCIDTNADCQDIALTGSGKGMYISDGKAVDITWEKENLDTDHTHYLTEDGSALKINPGKSYIAVIPEDYEVTLSK
ncbi:MAG TPA: DUF3048 domain-containing protein [Candidatus Scybalocola faecipullorum]|nr:DUF3048 domain-containing protein [Candidatus Scybalocola faecipullorum]